VAEIVAGDPDEVRLASGDAGAGAYLKAARDKA
jgi:hypothetical protein